VENVNGAARYAEGAAPTVLVAEDEVFIRLMMADELMRAGFQVIQCTSADEAWTVLQSSLDVGLVLTDIRMAGSMDGLELAIRIRSNWPHIKIVIASSEMPRLPIGDAFLSKPFFPQDLVACVEQLLARRNAKP
jgi:CheY-like chemotaxis protein